MKSEEHIDLSVYTYLLDIHMFHIALTLPQLYLGMGLNKADILCYYVIHISTHILLLERLLPAKLTSLEVSMYK